MRNRLMAQEQGRFSPAQILMAAEKAEADGRMDHAVQFYRYIAEQQSGAPEAEMARHALDRLAGRGSPPTEAIRAPGYPASRQPTSEAHINGFETPLPPGERTGQPSRFQPAGHSAALARLQVASQPASPPMQQASHAEQAYGPTFGPAPQAFPRPARSETTQPHAQARMPVLIRLPTPKRGYRAGRVLAVAVTGLGAIAIVVGLGLVGLTLFAPKELGRLGPGVAGLVGIGGSVGALFVGAAMVLAGQLARAVFDGANAMRELVSIERTLARHNSRPASSEDE